MLLNKILGLEYCKCFGNKLNDVKLWHCICEIDDKNNAEVFDIDKGSLKLYEESVVRLTGPFFMPKFVKENILYYSLPQNSIYLWDTIKDYKIHYPKVTNVKLRKVHI